MSPQTHSRPRGTTLIELTVVISMLVSLISALFVSARYYKEAADRAACVTLLSQYQKTIRGYENLNSLSPGDSLTEADLYGTGKPFEREPTCPLGNGKYKLLGEIPIAGVPFASCVDYDSANGTKDKSQAHTADNLASW